MRRTWFAIGAVIGASCAVTTVALVGGVPAKDVRGAAVRVVVGPTGELDVTPAGATVLADDMRAGGDAGMASVSVRNQTANPVWLRVDADPRSTEFDDDLLVEVRDGDAVVLAGPLADLRDSATATTLLGSGDVRSLVVTARLRAGGRGHEGSQLDIPLSIVAVPAHG